MTHDGGTFRLPWRATQGVVLHLIHQRLLDKVLDALITPLFPRALTIKAVEYVIFPKREKNHEQTQEISKSWPGLRGEPFRENDTGRRA